MKAASFAPPPRAAPPGSAPRARALALALAVAAACLLLAAHARGGGAPGVPVALARLRGGALAAPEAAPARRALPAARPTPFPDAAPVSLPQPLLTTLELLVLMHHVRGAAQYVEWGSGASTSLVAPLARRALSLENGVAWCAELRARADVRFWEANGGLKVVCVDTGERGGERERDARSRGPAAAPTPPPSLPSRRHRRLWHARRGRRPRHFRALQRRAGGRARPPRRG
jgi:hypothetical protein